MNATQIWLSASLFVIVLKLTGNIAWAWPVVLIPIMTPFIFLAAVTTLLCLVRIVVGITR